LTQRFNTNIPEIRDLLEDIGTEEISHWEMVGLAAAPCDRLPINR
jgi:Mn-containing catalase